MVEQQPLADSNLSFAKKTGYFLNTKGAKLDSRNAFFRFCRAENKPFIVILPNRKYTAVHVDLISTDFTLNDRGIDVLSYVKSGLKTVTSIYSKFEKILNEDIEGLLFDLLQIYNSKSYQQSIRVND
jgi:hypothetical protein